MAELTKEEREVWLAYKEMEQCLSYLQSHEHDIKALKYYCEHLKIAVDKLEKSDLIDEEDKLTLTEKAREILQKSNLQED